MKKLLYLLFILFTISIWSQTVEQKALFDSLQKHYTEKIKKSRLDSTLKDAYIAIYEYKMPNLYNTLERTDNLVHSEKIVVANAMLKFMQINEQKDLNNSFRNYNVNLYFEIFQDVVRRLIYQEEIDDVFQEVSYPIIERVVSNFNTSPSFTSMLSEQRLYYEIIGMKNSLIPNLVNFYDNPIGNQLTDYVIYNAADQLVEAVQNNNTKVIDILSVSQNPYAKTILDIAKLPNAKQVIPYIASYHENLQFIDTLNAANTDVKLIQLLIDKTIEAHRQNSPFVHLIEKYTEDKINLVINENLNFNHNLPSNKRFSILKQLRTQDLYLAAVFGDEYLYTSSLIGLFNEWKSRFQTENIKIFFAEMEQLKENDFIRIISDFGLLSDFLALLDTDLKSKILDNFLHTLKGSSQENKLKAMQMADAIYEISKDESLKNEVHLQIEKIIKLSKRKADLQNKFLYTKLDELLLNHDGKYTQNAIMSYNRLQDFNGKITLVMYFYGDIDGKSSYADFMSFVIRKGWKVDQSRDFIICTHTKNPDITLYANKPLDEKSMLDLQAQDNMMVFLKTNEINPKIIIHRGHSYYLYGTMMQFTGNEELAILGSCGGYENILDVYKKNNDTEVIATKQIGSKFINNPLIDEILTILLEKKDMNWELIWDNLRKQLISHQELLNEYVPPHQNYGLILLREIDKEE